MNIVATGLPASIEDYQVALNAAFAGGEAFGKAQQRTWVGLTGSEVLELAVLWSNSKFVAEAEFFILDFAREYEAKLKEKNGTSPQAKSAVQEGWKLVPIEPTDVMCINGGEAVFDRLRPDFDDTEQDQEAAIYIYKQMLAAAPQGSNNT